MRSDFLDTSNVYRLKAFFKYVDVANLASKSINELHIESPKSRACLVAVINATRLRAEQSAIDLFDPYVPPSKL